MTRMSMVAAFDVGAFTAPGTRYGTLNQDVVATQVMPTPVQKVVLPLSACDEERAPQLGKAQLGHGCFIGAVLDGHGILGEAAAARASNALLQVLGTSDLASSSLAALSDDQVKTLVEAAFRQGHASAMSIYDDPPKETQYPRSSGQMAKYVLHDRDGMQMYRTNGTLPALERQLECGTTCSLALVQGDELCVANVGDSLVVLGSLDGERVRAQVLTVQHSGLNCWEAVRIMQNHWQGARILPEDGYLAIHSGDWAGYQLSMTRALGHKHLAQHGVLPDPSISRCRLRPQDCCLVVASDAVFDVMSPEEVVNRVMDVLSGGGSAEHAAQSLVNSAIDLALCGPSREADNASAVVIALR